MSLTTKKTAPKTRAADPAWTMHSHPTYAMTTDPDGLFHVRPDALDDYWAMATSSEHLIALMRQTDGGMDGATPNLEIYAEVFLQKHGLIPRSYPPHERPRHRQPTAATYGTAVRQVRDQYGVDARGIADHALTLHKALAFADGRQADTARRAIENQRRTCECCRNVNPSTRRRILGGAQTTDAIDKLATHNLCEACYIAACNTLAARNVDQDTVNAFLAAL